MKTKKILNLICIVTILFAGIFVLTGCDNTEEKTSSDAGIIKVPMTVINKVPDTTIKELYLSGAGVDNWGDELLEGEEMPTNTQMTVTFFIDKNNIKWDIKAVDEEGTEVTFSGLDLSEVSTDGGTITLTMENGTPVAIAE